MNFDRSKFIAVLTGIFSLLLGFLYLAMVQILDMRGEMVPAPLGLVRLELVRLGLVGLELVGLG